MLKNFRRAAVVAFAAAIVLGINAQSACGQHYPNAEIQLLVPGKTGSLTEAIGTEVASALARALKSKVTPVEIGGSASGSITLKYKEPDGYTILLHYNSIVSHPFLYLKLEQNAINDFRHIGLVTAVPMVLMSRPDLEISSLEDLKRFVAGQKARVAFNGAGEPPSLCAVMIWDALDALKEPRDIYNVWGGGSDSEMLIDLADGKLDFMCGQSISSISAIRRGRVRPIAVTTKSRIKALPDVPTLDELGLKGFEAVVWYGLFAPKDTPQVIVTALSRALQQVLKDEKFVAFVNDVGLEVMTAEDGTPQALRVRVITDYERLEPQLSRIYRYYRSR